MKYEWLETCNNEFIRISEITRFGIRPSALAMHDSDKPDLFVAAFLRDGKAATVEKISGDLMEEGENEAFSYTVDAECKAVNILLEIIRYIDDDSARSCVLWRDLRTECADLGE